MQQNEQTPNPVPEKAPEKQVEEKDTTPKPHKVHLEIDKEALRKVKLVAVAYSHVEREWFPTEDAYIAEQEVEGRAQEVLDEVKKLGLNAISYPGDRYFLTNLLVDKPDFVINLVDTLRGKDALQTSVPAALELSNIPYTGAGMEGLVIGNSRNLVKHLLLSYDIPTPRFQYIRRLGTHIDDTLVPPLIIKLNESGGSVGIDNKAVQETLKDAERKVEKMISTYRMPVLVEQFVDGPEITAVVYDDGQKNHVFLGQKVFRNKPDGKHYFTSIESYEDARAYTYKLVEEPLATKISLMAVRAFNALSFKDYAKFDIRVDLNTRTPYFTDCNPNTAFGPDKGLPFTEVLALHGVAFQEVLGNMISRYAKLLRD